MGTPDPPDRRPVTVLDLMIVVAGLAMGLALWRDTQREVRGMYLLRSDRRALGASGTTVGSSGQVALFALSITVGLVAAGPLVVVRGWSLTRRFRCSTGEWAWGLVGLGWAGILVFLLAARSHWVMGLWHGAYGAPRVVAGLGVVSVVLALVVLVVRFHRRMSGRALARTAGLIVTTLVTVTFYASLDTDDLRQILTSHAERAARSSYPIALRRLFAPGTDINGHMLTGWRAPIHVVASHGTERAMAYLVERGARVDVRDSMDNTPLHDAGDNWRSGVTAILLDHGADVNARGWAGRTPLHVAASSLGEFDVARLLLDRGARVNATDLWDDTPLHLAAKDGEVEVVKLLLARGARVDPRGAEARTPLHGAAREGHTDQVKLLMSHGADVNARDAGGETPLHLAMQVGDRWGLGTPRHLAARKPCRETASLLLKHGADVNAKDDAGNTPLDLAVKVGRKEVGQLLKRHGAGR